MLIEGIHEVQGMRQGRGAQGRLKDRDHALHVVRQGVPDQGVPGRAGRGNMGKDRTAALQQGVSAKNPFRACDAGKFSGGKPGPCMAERAALIGFGTPSSIYGRQSPGRVPQLAAESFKQVEKTLLYCQPSFSPFL